MKKIVGLAVIALVMASCDITQKKEAELPEIDIDVETEAGQLPTFDVDWVDVNVGTRTKTVKIPKVVIVTEEEEIEVPYLDIDMPNADKEELNLIVEAEVTDKEHTIEIKEIIATNDKLYVISELKEGSASIGDKKMRVSDQIVLNAPDLNVRHIIIGEKPDRVFNNQHRYVKDPSSFKSNLKNSTVIYTK